MEFETLYITDKNDRPRSWEVHTDGPKVVVTHGLLEGKKTVKSTVSKAKNTGKANATTASEQAIKDAQSKWNAQVNRDDYNPDIEKAGQQMRPMLAHDYKKLGQRVNWKDKYWTQPKLDGLRLTCGQRNVASLTFDPSQQIEMLSRKGETYDLPHIVEHCEGLLNHINETYEIECLALDGEVYIHGMPLGQIVSRSRKYQEGVTEELEYHIFDLIIPGMGFEDRYNLLLEAWVDYLGNADIFKLVPAMRCRSEEKMKHHHGVLVEAGYEGVMLRAADGLYEIGGRSNSLFKYKEFFDQECKIIDVWKDQNGNAMLTCLWNHTDPTSEFRCTPKRTHAERKAMLNDQTLIGSWITVKFQEVSYATHPGGLPTFNTGLDIRECDENGEALI